MAKVSLVVRYRDADNTLKVYEVPPIELEADDFENGSTEGAQAIVDDGLWSKNAEGHLVLIPTHAIHRVDFYLNEA
ncbi:hypothetical protein [Streptomyces sp. NPDC004682]